MPRNNDGERTPLIDVSESRKKEEPPAKVKFRGRTVLVERKTPFMPVFLALAALDNKDVNNVLRAFGVEIFDVDKKLVWK